MRVAFASSTRLCLWLGLVAPGCVVGVQAPPTQADARKVPPPRAESAPEPRVADARAPRVWIDGYWHYDGVRYVWISGSWQDAAPSYAWRPR
jgi:hypothetical protein